MRITLPSLGVLGLVLCPTAHGEAAGISTITTTSTPRASAPAGTPGKPTSRKPAKKAKKPIPTADLVALNTHESFALQPGPQGGFNRVTMKRFARFLRCHHTQRVHPIAERLARLIYQTANHFGFQRIEVVAGYRAPRIAREKGNPKSPHKKGLACDFRIVGVTNETLRDYVRTYQHVGVGYYPNSGFVHLDVRDGKSGFWIDYSGPGERARYAPSPEDDLQNLVRKPAESADTDVEGVEPLGNSGSGGRTPNTLPKPPPTTEEDD